MSYQPEVYEKAWIQTYSGIAYPVLEPEAWYVSIEDIAHSLSNLCRFAGHTKEFYSVAQHCVLASYQVPEEDAFPTLMHDSPETYVVDLPRPVKHSAGLTQYRVIEDANWLAIAEAFEIDPVLPSSVKHADARMLLTEQRDLLGRQTKPWEDKAQPYDMVILRIAPWWKFWTSVRPWSPKKAKKKFLDRFDELVAQREPKWQTKPHSNSPWELSMQETSVEVLGT